MFGYENSTHTLATRYGQLQEYKPELGFLFKLPV